MEPRVLKKSDEKGQSMMSQVYQRLDANRLPQAMWQVVLGFGHRFVFAVVIFPVIMLLSCDEVETPLSELPPDTRITSGPEDGTVLTEPSVNFQWTGSNMFVNEFSYRCSPYQEDWSLWLPGNSITLHLDEGDYVFEVTGRYEAGNEDDAPDQRSFSIHFPAPGVHLKPFGQEVKLDQEFIVNVVVCEVVDVMLAHLILKFDPASLQALDAVPGGVFHTSRLPIFFKEIDDSRGIIDVNISTVSAKPSRINGTEEIAVIRFRSLSPGESSVTLEDGSELRDSGNTTIKVLSWLGCVIKVTKATP